MNWLDNAVGFENFPDAPDWLSPPPGFFTDTRNLLGFDGRGFPVFQDPADPSRAAVITQGVINIGPPNGTPLTQFIIDNNGTIIEQISNQWAQIMRRR